jgi:hypothetical protein
MPKEGSLVSAYLFLNVPLLIAVYLGFLLFIRPPKKVLLISLLGGVVPAAVNLLFDIAAYYAHWWNYYTTLKELTFHVPLPFYLSPLLVYGSLAYLLIWRFWRGRGHWLALLLLVGVPLFCIARDLYGGFTHIAYQEWENPLLATLMTILMWAIGFFAGFGLFWRTAKDIEPSQHSQTVEDEGAGQTSHVG